MAKLSRKQRKAKRRQDRRIAKQERRIDKAARAQLEAEGDPRELATDVRALVVHAGGREPIRIPPDMLARSKGDPRKVHAEQVFAIPRPPPGVLPNNDEKPLLAMDDAAQEISVWAAGTWASGWFDGPLFMGYPALSLFAALPEYRRMAEVLATECTRKWIRLTASNAGDKSKLDKITALETELKRIDVRGAMRRLIEQDAFFGIAHLYVDTGTDPNDRDELKLSIGNGRNEATKLKFEGRTNFLRGVKPIEAVWCYPSRYNATNPLEDDWYSPQTWFVQGLEIHTTRLLTFVGREVPDLLKPAYMFGGVSLSQLMKPYVDRWLATVQAVTDTIVAFSVQGIKTNLETALKPTGQSGDIFDRIELFNNLRSNRGAMVLDKETEEFFMFNVPLSELEALMAKMQETLCSISGEPVVKLLGIQPAGLNASSQGEITSWLDWCEAFREKFCAPHLTTLVDFAQLSLFGVVDPDITWTWESLRSLDPKEETERRKVQAEQDQVYIDAGVFANVEIRARLLADPESPYYGIEDITPDEPIGPVGAGLPDVNAGMAAEFPELAGPKPGPDPTDPREEGGDPRAERRGADPREERRPVDRRAPDRRNPDRREPARRGGARAREPEPVG